MSDPELWTTESLCFTYFNILHQYKTTKQVSAAAARSKVAAQRRLPVARASRVFSRHDGPRKS